MRGLDFNFTKLQSLLKEWNYLPENKFQIYSKTPLTKDQKLKLLKFNTPLEDLLIFKEIEGNHFIFNCEYLIHALEKKDFINFGLEMGFKINSKINIENKKTESFKELKSSLPRVLIICFFENSSLNFNLNIESSNQYFTDLIFINKKTDNLVKINNLNKILKDIYSLDKNKHYSNLNKMINKVNFLNIFLKKHLNFYDYFIICNSPNKEISLKIKNLKNNTFNFFKKNEDFDYLIFETNILKQILPLHVSFNNPTNFYFIKKWEDVILEKCYNFNIPTFNESSISSCYI